MLSDFDFDFDYWRELAERDPQRYFEERRQLIERFIAAAPPHLGEELRRLQALIDHTRAEAASPARATRQIMGMLGEHLGALAGQLEQLQGCVEGLGQARPAA